MENQLDEKFSFSTKVNQIIFNSLSFLYAVDNGKLMTDYLHYKSKTLRAHNTKEVTRYRVTIKLFFYLYPGNLFISIDQVLISRNLND